MLQGGQGLGDLTTTTRILLSKLDVLRWLGKRGTRKTEDSPIVPSALLKSTRIAKMALLRQCGPQRRIDIPKFSRLRGPCLLFLYDVAGNSSPMGASLQPLISVRCKKAPSTTLVTLFSVLRPCRTTVTATCGGTLAHGSLEAIMGTPAHGTRVLSSHARYVSSRFRNNMDLIEHSADVVRSLLVPAFVSS